MARNTRAGAAGSAAAAAGMWDHPAVARPRGPWGALQRHKRHAGDAAGRDRVAAHLRGKGMGGVDHLRDAFGVQIGRQPLDAADPPTRIGSG